MYLISVYDPFFDTHLKQYEYWYVFMLNRLSYLFSTTKGEEVDEGTLPIIYEYILLYTRNVLYLIFIIHVLGGKATLSLLLIEWNLQIMDTLGAGFLSSVERLSLSRRCQLATPINYEAAKLQ